MPSTTSRMETSPGKATAGRGVPTGGTSDPSVAPGRIARALHGRWLLGAGAVALAAALALVIAVNSFARRQQEAAGWVAHTLAVLEATARFEADLAGAGSEGRGFALDPTDDARQRVARAQLRARQDLAALGRLIADNPLQWPTIERIEPLLEARIAALRDFVDQVRTGLLPDDVLVARNQQGRHLTEQILAEIESVRREERRLLQARTEAANAAARWVMLGLVLCGIAIAASGLAIVAVQRARRRETRHLAELGRMNAALEVRVEERSRELARSEAEAHAREASFRHLAEQATDIVLRFDADGRASYASPAACRALGLGGAALLGTTLASHAHPEGRAVMEAVNARLLAGEAEEERLVLRCLRHDGAEIRLEGTARRPQKSGAEGVGGYVAVCRDVTAHRQLEMERDAQAEKLQDSNRELERLARHLARERDRAEQASRAKSLFLAGMSHELRTPLNGILGHAQLMRLENQLDGKQAEHVEAMLAAGQHLLDMINHVLTLSQIETEHVELQAVEIGLRGFAQSCLEVVRPAAQAKRLELRLVRSPDLPHSLQADPVRLRQVILNLLGNAVKYTNEGSIELRLRPAGDGSLLRIEVADTGPGIPAHRREHLFQAFRRLGRGAGQGPEGAGLGLAISARLVAIMGGRIGHSDNPGGGSVFWLELPLPAGSAETRLAPPPGPALRQPSRPLRVLVADDVAMNRDVASAFLRVAGHEAVCVEGGREAVEAVAQGGYDAVLMDIRMPRLDGCAATRRIRALPGPAAGVPIIALTAQAFADQVESCRQAGMDGHLAKPFTLETMLDALVRGMEAAAGRHAPPAAMEVPLPPAAAPEAVPSAPDAEPGLPVLDGEAFDQTVSFLPPTSVASHLDTLARRAESLLDGLRKPADLAALAAEAHTLAGSAGLFGFRRLATAARLYEHGLQKNPTEVATLTARLSAAIEASLVEIRRRAPAFQPA